MKIFYWRATELISGIKTETEDSKICRYLYHKKYTRASNFECSVFTVIIHYLKLGEDLLVGGEFYDLQNRPIRNSNLLDQRKILVLIYDM